MTPAELARDRATIAGATPGPWDEGGAVGYLRQQDAAFCAAARERWPAALAEIEQLRAALTENDKAVKEIDDENTALRAALAAMTAARDGIAEIAESYQHVAANALCGPCAVLVSVGAIELGTVEEIDALRAVGGGA